MPSSDHLQWFDITDFTPGVWDDSGAYNKFAAPANAFRKLDDYQPLAGGGLRPFLLPTTLTLPSLASDERPTGVFVRGGAVRTGTGGSGDISTDIILTTTKTSDFKTRIYRLDNTVTSPSWSLRHTTAAGADTAHRPVQFALFRDVNGVEWYLMSIYINSSATGLYKMQTDFSVASNSGNDGAVTKIATYDGPLAVSQARIIASSGQTIQYSDTGLTTYSGGTTSGSLNVSPNRQGAGLASITTVDPADLLIGKIGAPWVEINGAVSSTSTPVREMGFDHVPRAVQQPPQVPGGVAFIEAEGRVFITDGRNFKPISNQLAGRTYVWSGNMRAVGTMAYINGLLWIPGQNSESTGVIWNADSGALHKISGINPVFSWADLVSGKVYCVNREQGSSASFVSYDPLAGSRVSTGVIQTVPYADKNGRNIDIREVQVFALVNATTEFKCELLDEDGSSIVTRYSTVVGASREMVKFQFPATKRDYLSVKLTPRCTDGSSEAPTIEKLRIGFGINNLIV